MKSADELTRQAAETLEAGARSYACGGYIASLDNLHRYELYHDLEFDRLARKHTVIEEIYGRSCENWNQTFYVMLFRTLGDISNRETYMSLAQRVTYKMVLRERQSLRSVEALLFGCSGLLDNYRNDTYTLELKHEFEYFSRKYDITPLKGSDWNLYRIRSAEHPVLRIAQIAIFLADNDFVIEKVIECRTPADVRRLFGVEASQYWSTHYIPADISSERPKRVGELKANLVGINLVASLQYAYGSYMQDDVIRERAISLLEQIPAEDNRYIRSWRGYGIGPSSAFETQALIQLSTEYCGKLRCAECPVGRRIIKTASGIDKS